MNSTVTSRRSTLVALGALLSVAVTITGCGSGSGGNAPAGSSSTTTAASTSAPNTITIKNFMFSPMSLTVSPGAKITVTNQDSAAHTVTATGDKAFDTGDVGPGKTMTFTAPGKAGSYSYICDIHQYMTGTLVVK
jgi:plastocyanin